MTTRIKIGIVGSRSYTDKKKIKDLIFEIKEKYGDEVEIVSGGQRDGADGISYLDSTGLTHFGKLSDHQILYLVTDLYASLTRILFSFTTGV